MNFTQSSFWILLLPTVIIYWLLPKKVRVLFLLVISLAFYASWQVWYPLPLLISATVDYCCGHYISRHPKESRSRKLGLSLSILSNMSLLLFFKIFQKSYEILSSDIHFGVASGEAFRNVIFPVGISFYTFQTMSYSWDIYRSRLKPEKNYLKFLLYVSFFPQLMAGPIERAKRLMPQISHLPEKLTRPQAELGLSLIIFGLFKKILIANFIIHVINDLKAIHFNSFLIGSLMIFVVYYDFSGYSDMARGVAKLFGLNLMINFKPFYFSKNPTEFWETWNRSLTAWIRDYLFLPLKTHSKLLYIVQVYLFLILIGLWHDISLNWIIFGAYHATAILLFIALKPYLDKCPSFFQYMIMFFYYSFAGNLHLNKDFTWFTNLTTFPAEQVHFASAPLYPLFFLPVLFLFEWRQHQQKDYDFLLKRNVLYKIIFLVIFMVGITLGFQMKQYSFIYFMF